MPACGCRRASCNSRGDCGSWVQGAEGPSRLQALDPATGATVLDLALGERLALLPRNPALLFQGLFVVGTRGGRVLGYELPKD